jgi:hypothetical protein
LIFHIEIQELTEFDSVPAEVKARENHLSQPKSRPEGGEEGDRNYTQNIDKEDNQDGINESEKKYWV